MIEIYTDGSRVENSTIAPRLGWAIYIPDKNYTNSGVIEDYEKRENISRMELLAVKNALEYILINGGTEPYIIYCDNKGIVNCFKGKGSRRKDHDIWDEVYVLVREIICRKTISFSVEFLERKSIDQKSRTFQFAQIVDHLAFQAANCLCVTAVIGGIV